MKQPAATETISTISANPGQSYCGTRPFMVWDPLRYAGFGPPLLSPVALLLDTVEEQIAWLLPLW